MDSPIFREDLSPQPIRSKAKMLAASAGDADEDRTERSAWRRNGEAVGDVELWMSSAERSKVEVSIGAIRFFCWFIYVYLCLFHGKSHENMDDLGVSLFQETTR